MNLLRSSQSVKKKEKMHVVDFRIWVSAQSLLKHPFSNQRRNGRLGWFAAGSSIAEWWRAWLCIHRQFKRVCDTLGHVPVQKCHLVHRQKCHLSCRPVDLWFGPFMLNYVIYERDFCWITIGVLSLLTVRHDIRYVMCLIFKSDRHHHQWDVSMCLVMT